MPMTTASRMPGGSPIRETPYSIGSAGVSSYGGPSHPDAGVARHEELKK